jgi:hypothetical protein
MAALGCVDLVTWFDEDTPIARILECQPDVLVKGGDWAPERIVGAPETLARGGTALHPLRAPTLDDRAARQDPPALNGRARRPPECHPIHTPFLRRRVAMPAATGLAPPGSPGHRHNAGAALGWLPADARAAHADFTGLGYALLGAARASSAAWRC